MFNNPGPPLQFGNTESTNFEEPLNARLKRVESRQAKVRDEYDSDAEFEAYIADIPEGPGKENLKAARRYDKTDTLEERQRVVRLYREQAEHERQALIDKRSTGPKEPDEAPQVSMRKRMEEARRAQQQYHAAKMAAAERKPVVEVTTYAQATLKSTPVSQSRLQERLRRDCTRRRQLKTTTTETSSMSLVRGC